MKSSLLRAAAMRTMSTVLCLALCGCMSPQGETVDAQRADVLSATKQTLTEFQQAKPGLNRELKGASGYAVFNNVGLKILMAGTGNGYGIVHDNRTGKETFMRMAQVNVGLGFGIKKFRVIFVFNNPDVLRRFVEEGWEFGADAAAVVKAEGEGGGVSAGRSVNPIDIYQLTDTGVSLAATVGGTKYWKDTELNSASGDTVPANVRRKQKFQAAIE